LLFESGRQAILLGKPRRQMALICNVPPAYGFPVVIVVVPVAVISVVVMMLVMALAVAMTLTVALGKDRAAWQQEDAQ
jgi:hypothetical protein